MGKVSEEMDVPIQQIKKWVREERLAFSKDSGITISCEKCGKPILTGRFCKECKNSMRDDLSKKCMELRIKSLSKRKQVIQTVKMRFLKN